MLITDFGELFAKANDTLAKDDQGEEAYSFG